MKKSFLIFGLLTLTTCLASASTRPVRSLNDLPSKWEGVAGDLLTRTKATLKFDKVTKVVSREELPGGGFSATYDVDANLDLGTNNIRIKRVRLSAYTNTDGIYELSMDTDDELVFHLSAIVRYDEASNKFTLREVQRNAVSHFLLEGR